MAPDLTATPSSLNTRDIRGSQLAALAVELADTWAKRKAALPGGKTAYLARLCIVQPIACEERKGSKLLARGALGPWALGVGLLFSWGT